MNTRFNKELQLLINNLQSHLADTTKTEAEKLIEIDFEIEMFQMRRDEPLCDTSKPCESCVDLFAQHGM